MRIANYRIADITITQQHWASSLSKLDQHAAAVATMQPTVAALMLSRSKLAAWASIGFAGVVVFGWAVEAAVKWGVSWCLTIGSDTDAVAPNATWNALEEPKLRNPDLVRARRARRAALLPMPLLILPGCATTTAFVGTDAVACSAFEPVR